MRSRRLLALVASLAAFTASAEAEPPPTVAVVLVGSEGLSDKEVKLILGAAFEEMKAAAGFRFDASTSLAAAAQAVELSCGLGADCLLKVAEVVGVEAVVAMRARAASRRVLSFELVWVAADARGLPGESLVSLERTPREMDRGVRAGVRGAIPSWGRKGMGGLVVLAEAGSEVLVDGTPVGRSPLAEPVAVSVGVHRVDVVTPAGHRVTRTVEVAEARRQTVDLPSPDAAIAALTAPAPPEPKGRLLKTASFIVGGAGVAALSTGLVFGFQTNALNARIREGQCAGTPCAQGMTQVEAHRLYREAGDKALWATVGEASGALLVLGGGLMYWLSTREEEP